MPAYPTTSSASCSRFVRFLALAVCLLFLPLAADGGDVTEGSFTSGGDERTYSLAAPEDLGAEGEPVPLLLLFHGSGRDAASIVEPWQRLGEKEGFIVVAPNAADSRFWAPGADGPDLLRDLVDHLAQTYPIDRRRVYLFGHSAGGGFALQMGLLESRYFAAAAAHAGALADGTETWLPTKATRKIPFYIAYGSRDLGYPDYLMEGTRDALEGAGLPVTLVEIPKHDHNYYARSKKINQEVWEFLRGHALEEDPVFEPRKFQ